jgi:hypothetical protein
MMKKSDAFNSKYFKAADFPNEPMTLEIETVRFEDFERDGKPVQQKPVVYFVGEKRGLVIGPTQWDQIVDLTGEEDTDGWPGHRLELFRDRTLSPDNREVDCIRFRAPRQSEMTITPPKPKPTASTKPPKDMNDEIPF